MINEHDRVVLTIDLKNDKLAREMSAPWCTFTMSEKHSKWSSWLWTARRSRSSRWNTRRYGLLNMARLPTRGGSRSFARKAWSWTPGSDGRLRVRHWYWSL